MINNDLDLERWRRELQTRGHLQIPDFLQGDAAEMIRQCLLKDVPWVTAERGKPDRPAQSGCVDPAVLQDAYDHAREQFHFLYDRYLIIEAMKAGRDPGLLLHTVLEFFNSPQFLGFIRYFTGERDLNMVGAQATRYLPGEFLRLHDDHSQEEGRRYAYVLNLSSRWQPDWGGLLHFTDDRHNVLDTLVPRWNSLSLFKVPKLHYVSMVSPWAPEPRLAITGWWHAKHAPSSP